jgi:hypothetical protein
VHLHVRWRPTTAAGLTGHIGVEKTANGDQVSPPSIVIARLPVLILRHQSMLWRMHCTRLAHPSRPRPPRRRARE